MSLNPSTLQKQYKEKLSNYLQWKEEVNPEALVYPENFGEHMSIDETSLHNGEIYTVITNKAAKGKKGSLAALIKGTKNKTVTKALNKVPIKTKMKVRTITADLANSMDWICRTNFMNATIVADRFHFQKIVSEAVQEIRVKERWKAIDEENKLITEARRKNIIYFPFRYSNGDSKKQLLARGRYLLFKPKNKWTKSQKERAEILFNEFPELKKSYDLSMYFRGIFETSKTRKEGEQRLKKWFVKVEASKIKPLISSSNTISINLGKILNYFPDKQSNASAESFNAKLKGFRALVRGVRDQKFFLFRIEKLYA